MRIRLLGTFEVLVDGQPVALAERPRSLLATLALSSGRAVSVDGLADAIWGDEPPARVKGSIQTMVRRLRQAVGEDVIATRSIGYELVGADVDVHAFHRLLEAAAGDQERPLLAEAVALWRGEPLDGITSAALRAEHVPQLEERYLTAVERRVDLDLAAGTGADLPTELRALTGRFPLRELLWERLIRALAEAGRSAEALAAYAHCRQLLTDELGVEPNTRLRQLHLDLLRTSDEPAPAATIPQPLTRLFGRDDEVAVLVNALVAGTNRLITLTGVAGIGKTRLALAAALAAGTRGLAAWWVPLSSVPAADQVLPAIADAVEAPAQSVAGIAQRFGRRPALVVVDNLEHLDGVGPVLTDLLTRLPGLRLLATSRAPAEVDGEQEWLVPALPVPDGLDAVAAVPSVALFVDRVRAATPSFRLTAEVIPVVVDICRQLHGLPLGLELAAGQWRVRGDTIAASIRAAPLELRGGRGSLRDAIAASVALLDDQARDTLCRLAVFRDGWTYDLAVAATGDDLLEPLDRLVALGLVQTTAGRRFSMVPTIQAFAAEQARDRDVADTAAAGHAHAIRRLVDQTRPDLYGDNRARTLATLDAERDNLLFALSWFKDHDPNAGLAMISALRTYWQARGRDEEGFACYMSFLDLATDPVLVAKALAEGAELAATLGHADDAAALLRRQDQDRQRATAPRFPA